MVLLPNCHVEVGLLQSLPCREKQRGGCERIRASWTWPRPARTQFGETAALVKGSRPLGDFQVNLDHFGSFLFVSQWCLRRVVFLSNALLGRGMVV